MCLTPPIRYIPLGLKSETRCILSRVLNSHQYSRADEIVKLITILEQPDGITPFQRAVSITTNPLLYKDAAHTPSLRASLAGEVITLAGIYSPPLQLPVVKLRMVVCGAIMAFKVAVEAALPPGLDIARLSPRDLVDDFSGVPLHQQHSNSEVLAPLLEDGWQCLDVFDGSVLIRSKVDSWLTLYDACYPLLAAVVMLTTGGITDSAFRHQQYSGPARTVFLLRNGTPVLINPHASRRWTNHQLDLTSLPVDVSQHFVALVVVLLPLANKLRGMRGQSNPFHETHLWVEPRQIFSGTRRALYNANSANAALKPLLDDILGVSLSGDTICKMIRQILRQEYPFLWKNTVHLRCAVDDLAQHCLKTGAQHYGRPAHFPEGANLTGDKPARHLTLCEIWQSFISSGPVNAIWRNLVSGSALFPYPRNTCLAFNYARYLVLNHYNIKHARSKNEREQLVKQILLNRPFLLGLDVSQILSIALCSF